MGAKRPSRGKDASDAAQTDVTVQAVSSPAGRSAIASVTAGRPVLAAAYDLGGLVTASVRVPTDQVADIAHGGYVLLDADDPAVVIIATGSEVALAVEAAGILDAEGIGVRVVSMPCVEVFDRQAEDQRQEVLPPGIPRVVVEAGVTGGWHRHSAGGPVLGIDRFGESAPGTELFEHFSLTSDALATAARRAVAPVR